MLTSSNQIRDYWNSYSDEYGTELEPVYFQSALNLTRMLKVEDKKSILEVGCGTGELTLYWLRHLPDGHKYTSIDLSDNMLKIATRKKEEIKPKLSQVEHIFINEDAENLVSIQDRTIDAYIASLVIHLTNNPHKLLQEAYRVLKKEGKIGFTVWGKIEDSSFFNIAHSALKDNGIEVPSKSSGSLPLGGREPLIKLAEDNGFKVEFCWNEPITFDIFDEKGLKKILGQPRIAKVLADLDIEMRKKVEDDIQNALYKMKLEHIPLQAQIFYLIGHKP